MIYDDIMAAEGLGAVDFARTSLKQAITEIVDSAEAEEIQAKYLTGGGADALGKMPKGMQAPFFFTNLRFEWNQRANGLISQPITGIVSSYGKPMFKDFTVRLMIRYFGEGKNTGTQMGLMIEVPGKEGVPGNYYFIAIEGRGTSATNVYLVTSNKELKNYLSELKPDKLKQKKVEIKTTGKGGERILQQYRTYISE